MYRSTRSDRRALAPEALIEGISPDGGLYVPESFPSLDPRILDKDKLSYAQLSYLVLRPFFPSFDESGLKAALAAQSERFPADTGPAPLSMKGGLGFLELYHGPTLAFKDLALTLMGPLMGLARSKLGIDDEIVILVATSGDTGKAALEGLARPGKSADGIRVLVFYPSEGVSAVQKLQMTSHNAPGATVIGIRGNFDDAQRGVKTIFANKDTASFLSARGMRLSSANSINIARLMPQIVYYVWGYRAMRDAGSLGADGLMDVAVPTGNFGNILAAWYAKQMGLPIGRLVCASNRNRVLSDFFGQNAYDRNRPFYKTESPSMDILVSSNLERLVFHATGDDPSRTASLMKQLAEAGRYSLSDAEAAKLADFRAGWSDEAESQATMRRFFEDQHYLMDTHTAVAVSVLEKLRAEGLEERPTLVASTASPFKFPAFVAKAIGLQAESQAALSAAEELDLADRLAEAAGLALPPEVRALRSAPIVHSKIVEAAEMEKAVREALS